MTLTDYKSYVNRKIFVAAPIVLLFDTYFRNENDGAKKLLCLQHFAVSSGSDGLQSHRASVTVEEGFVPCEYLVHLAHIGRKRRHAQLVSPAQHNPVRARKHIQLIV